MDEGKQKRNIMSVFLAMISITLQDAHAQYMDLCVRLNDEHRQEDGREEGE
jgi:hypothetical protein